MFSAQKLEGSKLIPYYSLQREKEQLLTRRNLKKNMITADTQIISKMPQRKTILKLTLCLPQNVIESIIIQITNKKVNLPINKHLQNFLNNNSAVINCKPTKFLQRAKCLEMLNQASLNRGGYLTHYVRRIVYSILSVSNAM